MNLTILNLQYIIIVFYNVSAQIKDYRAQMTSKIREKVLKVIRKQSFIIYKSYDTIRQ